MSAINISFFVHGKPMGQPRTKAVNRGKHAGVYTPGTADGWKALVAAEAKKYLPPSPLTGALEVSLIFYFPRPKRLLRKKDPTCCIPHTSKPDRDNLDKAVLDILTRIGMFSDDCIVYNGRIMKLYVATDPSALNPLRTVPGVYVSITQESDSEEPTDIG